MCSVGKRWVALRADRDLKQQAQMVGSKCSLYASDLLPGGQQDVMVLCKLFAASFVKLQKVFNEGSLCFSKKNKTKPGQGYGRTVAADIQTMGRKVDENIKRSPLKSYRF